MGWGGGTGNHGEPLAKATQTQEHCVDCKRNHVLFQHEQYSPLYYTSVMEAERCARANPMKFHTAKCTALHLCPVWYFPGKKIPL